MKKFWSGEETRRNGDELFRVKVVGSNPAGPTKNQDLSTKKLEMSLNLSLEAGFPHEFAGKNMSLRCLIVSLI